MTTVVLFPSVLGVRAGITETADRLRAAGHQVRIADVLDGRTFDDYDEAIAHDRATSDEHKHGVARDALDSVDGGFHTLGFSSGCVLAEWTAAQRPQDAGGVTLVGGAIPLEWVEAAWPPGVPAQTHQTTDDPFDDGPEAAATFRRDVEAAGGTVEEFRYAGSGHLFNDPSLTDEHQPEDAELFYERLLAFLGPA